MNPKKALKSFQQAVLLYKQGNFVEAEKSLAPACKALPNEESVQFLMGALRFKLEKYVSAIDFLSKAKKINPSNAETLNNLGMCFEKICEFDKAISNFKSALAIKPDYTNAQLNLGNAYQNSGNFQQAEGYFNTILQQDPNNVMAINNIALCQLNNGNYALTQKTINHGLALAPGNVSLLMTHGVLLQYSKQYEQAIEHFQSLNKELPNDIEILNNLALSYKLDEQYALSEKMFKTILSIDPQHSQAHANLSQLALFQQNYSEGWDQYRFRSSARETGIRPEILPLELSNKHILLIKDQGLGDEIFFLRFTGELKSRGAEITYIADPRLIPMLSNLDTIDHLVEKRNPKHRYDNTLLIADLPWALQTTSTPPPIRLTSDKTADEKVVLALKNLPQERPTIGITWRAGTRGHNRLGKEIDLQKLCEYLTDTNANYVSLQRNPEAGELEELERLLDQPVHDFSVHNQDLDFMLALLGKLDGHICVSNTNLHLRESLNKPTVALIPYPADFRWPKSEHQSPWFPHCKVIRQNKQGIWDIQPGFADIP